MNTLIKSIDSSYLIGYLEEKLQEEKEFFNLKKNLLNDQQLKDYGVKIKKLEETIVSLATTRIKERLCTDSNPSMIVEVLTFLLNEFFTSTAFRKKHHNEELLTRMVYQTAQVISDLNKLPPQAPLSF